MQAASVNRNRRLSSTSTKSKPCAICNKQFSRADHRRRHELQHSGVTPYSCTFCRQAFQRSEVLRDHYASCPERGTSCIPPSSRGGRRSHACDRCTSSKVRCDGQKPCTRCRERDVTCIFTRGRHFGGVSSSSDAVSTLPLTIRSESISSVPTPTAQMDQAMLNAQEAYHSLNRTLIRSLLCRGSKSFMERFCFPAENIGEESGDPAAACEMLEAKEESQDFSLGPLSPNAIDWTVIDGDGLFAINPDSVADMNAQFDDWLFPYGIDLHIYHSTSTSTVSPLYLAQPGNWSEVVLEAMLEIAKPLDLSPEVELRMRQDLDFLLTPLKFVRLIDTYFESWHKNCPILHQPSFDASTKPPRLLAAVVIMGALYSPYSEEVAKAKAVLDLAELYVFSSEDMCDEFEIKRSLAGTLWTEIQSESSRSLTLQNLYASYIVSCAQVWAGSSSSRKRALETRFSSIIKSVRRLGLTTAQHDASDRADERLWIEKEEMIRHVPSPVVSISRTDKIRSLISTATLLDCALCFFANFPCRLMICEMKFHLPFDERIFSRRHPFAEPDFNHSRQLTALEAYRSLFGHRIAPPTSLTAGVENSLGLAPMDMFLLVHLLYVQVHTYLTQLSSIRPHQKLSKHQSGLQTPDSPLSGPPSTISLLTAALDRWWLLWRTVRASIPSETWSAMGFFKNATHYWLVTQLLIHDERSGEFMTNVEAGCEDNLSRLRELVANAGAESP